MTRTIPVINTPISELSDDDLAALPVGSVLGTPGQEEYDFTKFEDDGRWVYDDGSSLSVHGVRHYAPRAIVRLVGDGHPPPHPARLLPEARALWASLVEILEYKGPHASALADPRVVEDAWATLARVRGEGAGSAQVIIAQQAPPTPEDACCGNERRNDNGGCDECGDPSF